MGDVIELSTDVLIVGAGPSGLMLAVCLTRLGVDAVIVDGKSGPTRESRALAVQARSMELYDQLGLVDRVLAESHPARKAVPGFRDRPFGIIALRGLGAGVTPYPEITVLEQSRNEAILVGALEELGRAVRWEHRLAALDEAPGRADAAGRRHPMTATLDSPDGPITVRARYCVGADGAHSIVRGLRGIPFEGITNEHTFYVIDAHGATGLVDGAINIRFNADDFLLAFPMGPGGHTRLLGIVRDGDRAVDGTLPESLVRERAERGFGVRYRDSSWFATYRLHHRLAARFRDGAFFLAGDAAHIHSPVGAQGMNTGLQEAHNLACAFADVLVGGMPDARLDRYEVERRPVAALLVGTTDRAFAMITSDSRFARFARGRIVPLLGPIAVRLVPRLIGGERVFGYLSQTRIHYRMTGPGGSGRRGRRDRGGRRDPVVGRRLPWTGANYDVLRSMTWQVHGYGVLPAEVERIASELGVEAHVFGRDPNGRLRPDRVYLVRRDGFVAAEASAHAVPGGPRAFREQLAG